MNKIYLKQADFLNNAGRDRALTLSKVHKTSTIFNEQSLRHRSQLQIVLQRDRDEAGRAIFSKKC